MDAETARGALLVERERLERDLAQLQGGETGSAARTDAVGNTLPGAIGARRHPQAGPGPESSLDAALQPVAIRGPKGMTVSAETFEGWSAPAAAPFRTSLLVGSSYRLRAAGIRGYEGLVHPDGPLVIRMDGVSCRFVPGISPPRNTSRIGITVA